MLAMLSMMTLMVSGFTLFVLVQQNPDLIQNLVRRTAEPEHDAASPSVPQETSLIIPPASSLSETKEKEEEKQQENSTMDLEPVCEQFVSTLYQETIASSQDPAWSMIHQQSNLRVYRHHDTSSFMYKVHGQLDSPAEKVIQLLVDTESRKNWDELIEESRVLRHLNSQTRLIYIRMKAIWPTASRDLVLLSHCRLIRDPRPSSTASTGPNTPASWVWLNVTKSVVLPDVPERTQEGIVRMETPLSGQIIRRLSNTHCEMIQLANGDPKGWIPSSVVQFVACKAVPRSFDKLNGLLKTLDWSLVNPYDLPVNWYDARQPGRLDTCLPSPPTTPVPTTSIKPAFKNHHHPHHQQHQQHQHVHHEPTAKHHHAKRDRLQQAQPWILITLAGAAVTHIAIKWTFRQ